MERNVPKLRFKGFNDEWKEKKISELNIKLVRGPFGSALKKENMVSKNIDTYKVYEQKHAINKDERIGTYYISKEKYLELKRFEVKPGDFIMSCSGTVGEIFKIPEGAERGIINQALLKITVGVGLNENYFLYNFKQNLNKLEVKGSGIKNITSVKFLKDEFKIQVPSIQEQERIANFLTKVDKIIEKQDEKVKNLEKYKNGMMQKIFSQEIRFKDENGEEYPEWEVKKITEIANTFIGLVTTMTENYVESGVKLIRNSDIKENKILKDSLINLDVKFAEKNSSRYLKYNDVVTVHTGDIGTSAVIKDDLVNSLGFATINTRPDNKKVDSDYLAHYFNSYENKKYAIRMSTGDGRSNYNLKDFDNCRVKLPCLQEQKKIAVFLYNINSILEKEKFKIEKLRDLKKALLQKMFI